MQLAWIGPVALCWFGTQFLGLHPRLVWVAPLALIVVSELVSMSGIANPTSRRHHAARRISPNPELCPAAD